MTRTARSASLRALMKDRSESRNNRDNQLRKGGAGQHNWGSVRDEAQFEEDVQLDLQDEQADTVPAPVKENKTIPERRASIEDVASAKEFRKHALEKDGIDLSAIARTSSAVSSSPTSTVSHASAV